MLRIGQILEGRYKTIRVLGQGGTSYVYLVEDLHMKRYLAVKEVYKNATGPSGPVRNGLIVESKLLIKLRHSSLPEIFDVFENQKAYFIVMEYIEGQSLDKVLEKSGAQPEHLVIKWAKQICDVLGYLHTRQPPIIYRDVKPSNIMLRPDGNVTLIDFGTARELKPTGKSDTVYWGTYGYAAPEQCKSTGRSDARTDIYGFGVTLHHLVTGRNPCIPPYELLPVRQVDPRLSFRLEQIIQTCTQINAENRYQSMDAMMRDLSTAQPVENNTAGLGNGMKKSRKLYWLLLLIPVFLLIVGVVTAALVTAVSDAVAYVAENLDLYDGFASNYLLLSPLNEVYISSEDEHVYFVFKPEDSGRYHFYSISDEEVPIAWLSDENDKTLHEENTYGYNEEFDFTYYLTKNYTYYIEVALYDLREGDPETGRFFVLVEFVGD